MKKILVVIFMALNSTSIVCSGAMQFGSVSDAHAWQCKPTRPDMLGPFYKEGAPLRDSIGRGYHLTGTVMSASDCSPVVGAVIEFWLTGPDGSYDDDHRARVFSDESGRYSFHSNVPPAYYGRPPHIHIRVSIGGFETLVTQHYPKKGKASAVFDLVLIPKR